MLSGLAERYGVDARGAQKIGASPTETLVLFGARNDLVGMPVAEGHPEPTILADVRRMELTRINIRERRGFLLPRGIGPFCSAWPTMAGATPPSFRYGRRLMAAERGGFAWTRTIVGRATDGVWWLGDAVDRDVSVGGVALLVPHQVGVPRPTAFEGGLRCQGPWGRAVAARPRPDR